MIGVVVEKVQVFYSGPVRKIHHLRHGGMPPPDLGIVFVILVRTVGDQNVGLPDEVRQLLQVVLVVKRGIPAIVEQLLSL